MSQAEELLNSVSANNEIAVQTADPQTEGHIIVDSNRFITVPDELKRIAVANDHNIETVTFECPRYWDGHDLSQMQFYINYKSPDDSLGCYVVEALSIDPATEGKVLYFDWTITRNVAKAEGKIVFLVCAKQVDKDGNEVLHWNSELCEDLYVSEGLECDDVLEEEYPDLYTQLLELINNVNTSYPDMYPKVKQLAGEVEKASDKVSDLYRQTKIIYDDLDKLGVGNGLLYTPNAYHRFYNYSDIPDIFSSKSEVVEFYNAYTKKEIPLEKMFFGNGTSSLNNSECSIWQLGNFCRILYRVALNYPRFQNIWNNCIENGNSSSEASYELAYGVQPGKIDFKLSVLSDLITDLKIKPIINPTSTLFSHKVDVSLEYFTNLLSMTKDPEFIAKTNIPAIMRQKQLSTGETFEILLQDIGGIMYNPLGRFGSLSSQTPYFPTHLTIDMTFPCEEVGSKVAIANLPQNYIEIAATEVSTQNNTMYSGGVEQ